jgi:hypothetical protein
MLRSLLLSAIAVFGTVTVKDCSSATAGFQLRTLEFTPSNPLPGENGTLRMVYHAPEVVAGGTVDYKCTLNGFPVLQESSDLCTATTCPITVGEHEQRGTVPTPDTKGSLACSLTWYSTDKKELLCAKTTYLQSVLRGVSIKDEL